jgi:hypothetical protein
MNSLEQHGIYMFSDVNSEKICLLLYKKCDHTQLSIALPLSYHEDSGDYMLVIFKNGKDHLCQTTYDNINKLVKQHNMVDIYTNEWTSITSKLPLLKKEDYINSLRFAKEQLKL